MAETTFETPCDFPLRDGDFCELPEHHAAHVHCAQSCPDKPAPYEATADRPAYTPAPWTSEYRRASMWTVYAKEGGKVIAEVGNPFSVPDRQDEADARLIAAAPLMAEALAWMVAYIGEHPDFIPSADSSEAEWFDTARAALKEAGL